MTRLTVIDLSPLKPSLATRLRTAVGAAPKGAAPAPKIIATLQAGKGAAGVSFNKAGTLALVANRIGRNGFRLHGQRHDGGAGRQGDGRQAGLAVPATSCSRRTARRAFVTRDNDHRIVVLSVDGTKVEATKREIAAGLRPYCLDIAAKGEVAVVANIGIGRRRCRHHQRHRSQARPAACRQQLHRRPDPGRRSRCRRTASSSPSPS